MKKYEYTRIPSNSSLEELGRYRSEGWRILLVHKFDGREFFLMEKNESLWVRIFNWLKKFVHL